MCDSGSGFLNDTSSGENANPLNAFADIGNQIVGEHGSHIMDDGTKAFVNWGEGYGTGGALSTNTADALVSNNPNYWHIAGNAAKSYLMHSAASGGETDGESSASYDQGADAYAGTDVGSSSGAAGSSGYDQGADAYAGTDVGGGSGASNGANSGGLNSLSTGEGAWDSPAPTSSATTTPTINATPSTSTADSWLNALSGYTKSASDYAKSAKPYVSLAQSAYQMMNAYQAKKKSEQAQQAAQAERAPYVQQLQALMANPGQVLPNTPGYQAGLQAVQRAQAAQGYQGSGNMMAALQQYGGNAYNQQAATLSQLAGRPYDPNGANALARDEYTQGMMNNGFYNFGRFASSGNAQ